MYQYRKTGLSVIIALLLFTSCKEQSDYTTLDNVSYDLAKKDIAITGGSVTMTRLTDTSSAIRVILTDVPKDSIYEAVLRNGNISAPKDTALLLNYIQNRQSETIFSHLKNGQAITYKQLLKYNGCVFVYKRHNTDSLSIVAEGNIGSNAH